jgi:hypothetical protein
MVNSRPQCCASRMTCRKTKRWPKATSNQPAAHHPGYTSIKLVLPSPHGHYGSSSCPTGSTPKSSCTLPSATGYILQTNSVTIGLTIMITPMTISIYASINLLTETLPGIPENHLTHYSSTMGKYYIGLLLQRPFQSRFPLPNFNGSSSQTQSTLPSLSPLLNLKHYPSTLNYFPRGNNCSLTAWI